MRATLDTDESVIDLTRALIDIPSESGSESALADAIESVLVACAHLDVVRDGDAVVARTTLGRAQRVIIAGHIDTVPINANVPSRLDEVNGERVVGGFGPSCPKSTPIARRRLCHSRRTQQRAH